MHWYWAVIAIAVYVIIVRLALGWKDRIM